tara:strand:+ start:905 stop:1321 length:417 start_codon:yes stop_codon:yes gene_type:complete
LEDLQVDKMQFMRMTCCGKATHKHCTDNFFGSSLSREQKGKCPHCQVKLPKNGEEQTERVRGWAEKGKAWAQASLGCKYNLGDAGVEQSYEKMVEYYTLAIKNGDPNAMFIWRLCMKREKILHIQSKKLLNFIHKQPI